MLYAVEILEGNPRDVLEEAQEAIEKEQRESYFSLLARLLERALDLVAINVLQRPEEPLLAYGEKLLAYRIFRAMGSPFRTPYAISFTIDWLRLKGKDYLVFNTNEERYFKPILASKKVRDVSFRSDDDQFHEIFKVASGREDQGLLARFILDFKPPKAEEGDLVFQSLEERAHALALEHSFFNAQKAFEEIEGDNNLLQTTEALNYMVSKDFQTEVAVTKEELKNNLVDISWALLVKDPQVRAPEGPEEEEEEEWPSND